MYFYMFETKETLQSSKLHMVVPKYPKIAKIAIFAVFQESAISLIFALEP